ncbi:hypothetical protein ABT236_22600 [Streptomyces sp. NPDC001523]|uniref:hypothetical protein n=1 Tax=Streptomyces sp. NPDC001523 TaxID=3154383 RepID=UPI00332BBF75
MNPTDTLTPDLLLSQIRQTARNLAASPLPNAHRILAALPQTRSLWWGMTSVERRMVLLLISWAAQSVRVAYDGTAESLFADALTFTARTWAATHPTLGPAEFCETKHEAAFLAYLLASGPDLETSHQLSLAMTALIPVDL